MHAYILCTFVYLSVFVGVCVCVWIVFIFADDVYIWVRYVCVSVLVLCGRSV